MSALLAVSDLHVRFPVATRFSAAMSGGPRSVEVLAGVSLSVAPGETYAVVGESGSGKTTLGRTVVGLVRASEGSIVFDGTEVVGRPERQLAGVRREIGLIFQDPLGSLSPRLTIRSILAEPFRVHGGEGDLKNEAARLLDVVGLPQGFASRYPHQLSGGQLRRVGIARALALRPKLVIADEPTAGLDVSVQGEMLNLLNALQAEFGIALFVITHNLHVVRHVADRMAVMYLGRIVEEGGTADIFAHPRHRYTAALLSANPVPDPDAARLPLDIRGDVPSLVSRPPGCEFHPRCRFALDVCTRVPPPRTVLSGGDAFTCHNPG
jgi:oligopeptide/dipeptide ABC transporter ATP-binding protein